MALILAGCLSLAYREIRYTRREKVLDVGPIKASMDVPESLNIPPLVGGLIVAGGVVMLVLGIRKN